MSYGPNSYYGDDMGSYGFLMKVLLGLIDGVLARVHMSYSQYIVDSRTILSLDMRLCTGVLLWPLLKSFYGVQLFWAYQTYGRWLM